MAKSRPFNCLGCRGAQDLRTPRLRHAKSAHYLPGRLAEVQSCQDLSIWPDTCHSNRLGVNMRGTWTVALLLLSSAFGQRAPVTSNPKIDLAGVIQEIRIAPGQGMPYMIIDVRPTPVRVHLGSIRYLIEHNFNPKAGQRVRVHGYKLGDDVMAATVTTDEVGTTLRLRDENGWPMWHGGMRRQGRMR